MTQNKLIVSNWKMNLELTDSKDLVNKILKLSQIIKPHIKKIICPQFLLIPHVSSLIKKTRISLGSQDCHYFETGAFTGESSVQLLKKFQCKYVILGHSEKKRTLLRDKFYYFEKNKHCVTSWFDTNCLYWRTNKIEKKKPIFRFSKNST